MVIPFQTSVILEKTINATSSTVIRINLYWINACNNKLLSPASVDPILNGMLRLRGTQFAELIHSLWYNVRVDANKTKLGFGFKRRRLLNHSFNYATLLLATHPRHPSFVTITDTYVSHRFLPKLQNCFEMGSHRGHNTSSSERTLEIT